MIHKIITSNAYNSTCIVDHLLEDGRTLYLCMLVKIYGSKIMCVSTGAATEPPVTPPVIPDKREEYRPLSIWERQQFLLIIGIPFFTTLLYILYQFFFCDQEILSM